MIYEKSRIEKNYIENLEYELEEKKRKYEENQNKAKNQLKKKYDLIKKQKEEKEKIKKQFEDLTSQNKGEIDIENIKNLFKDDELYCELIQEPEDNHLSGFIYNLDNKDYLCSSSYNGYINIWDLFNKSIHKIISTNDCVLCHIIQWNNKYSIVADYDNKSFKIIDFEKGQVVKDIKGEHTDKVPCIKKIYHPLY